MIRPTVILLAGIVVGAARLPLPPTPPVHVPAGDAAAERSSLPLPPRLSGGARAEAGEPAPLPNDDLQPPASGPETEKFNVRIFSLDEHDGGMAFIPGSTYRAPEARKPMQTPGVTVSLPLQ